METVIHAGVARVIVKIHAVFVNHRVAFLEAFFQFFCQCLACSSLGQGTSGKPFNDTP